MGNSGQALLRSFLPTHPWLGGKIGWGMAGRHAAPPAARDPPVKPLALCRAGRGMRAAWAARWTWGGAL